MSKEPIAWSRAYFDRISRYTAGNPEVPSWARMTVHQHPLHPTVSALLDKFAPVDWREVLAQWPHVSMKDPARLAYTPNEKYASGKRVLVTSPGKYAAKHWPHVPAHELRDMALLTTTPAKMYFVHTTPEMIIGVEYGPPSCMASSSSWCGHAFKHQPTGFSRLADWVNDPTQPEPEWALHPYASYGPQDGWHMALRKEDNIIQARAVCLTFQGQKYFVRSYRHGDGDGFSPTCETLNAWLKDQGYQFVDDWPDGARLDIDDGLGGTRAPYLDGDRQRVERITDNVYVTDRFGSIVFTDTGGGYDYVDDDECNDEDMSSCDCCGAEVYSEDMYAVGRHDDTLVCDYCVRHNYRYVQNDTGDPYRIHRDDARIVLNRNYYIDPDHPPDDVIDMKDIGWVHEDDVIEVDNDLYLHTDPKVVQTADDGWRLREDCWQDDETRLWYSNEEPFVEQRDGKRYHETTVEALRKVDQLELL